MRLLVLWVAAAASCAAQINQNRITIIPLTDLSATGELRFRDKQATPHYVGFKAAGTIASDLVWELPAADSAGCWYSNGSGVISISSCSAVGVVDGFLMTGDSSVNTSGTNYADGVKMFWDTINNNVNIRVSNGSSPNSDLIFRGGSSPMLDLSLGGVGLSTVNIVPAAATFNTSQLEVTSASTVDPRLFIASEYQDGNYAATLLLRKARGTLASPTTITNGQTISSILSSAWNGSAWQYPAYITAQAEVSGSDVGASMRIATRAPGGSLTEKLSVRSNGEIVALTGGPFIVDGGGTAKLRIGTASGADNFQIRGNVSMTGGSTQDDAAKASWAVSVGDITNDYAGFFRMAAGGSTFDPLLYLNAAGRTLFGTTTDDSTGARVQVTGFVSATTGYYSPSSASNALNIPNGGLLAKNATVGSSPNYIIYQHTSPQIDATALGAAFNFNTSGNLVLNPGTSSYVIINKPVGIGVSAPAGELEVVSGGTTDPRGVISTEYQASNFAATFQCRKSGGTLASPSALTNGHTICVLLPSAWNGSAWQYPGYIAFQGEVSGGNIGASLNFATRAPGGSLVERLSISSGGTINVPNAGLLLLNSTSSVQFNSGSFAQMQSGSAIVFASGARTQGDIVPSSSGADDLGASGNRFGKLWIQDIDMSGTITGLSLAYVPLAGGTMTGDLLVTGSNDIGSSSVAWDSGYFNHIVLKGSSPQIDGTGLGAALNINGASSSNGNIVLNAGNVTGSSSVVVNGRLNSASTQALRIIEVGAAGGTGISLFHASGSTFDAAWQAGSSTAFDVVLNNASTHAFIVLQTGVVLINRTSDDGTGQAFQIAGGLHFTGTLVPPSGTAQSGTFTCAGGQHINQLTLSQGIVTGLTCN